MRTMNLVVAVLFVGGSLFSSMGSAVETNATDPAMAGIKRVSDSCKYAFVLFHRGGDGAAGIRETVRKAVEDVKGQAEAMEIDVAAPASESIVKRYGINRAPLPVVLVIAPNGAVAGGFPGTCDPNALAEAMVGPKAASCLKILQEGKVVIVCVQPKASKTTEATLKAVTAFKEDKRISGFAESVVIDSDDQAEKGFLGKLRVDVKSEAATIILMTPPGRVVGTYTNEVTAAAMFADLARSLAGSTCGGSSGCGPSAGGCQ